MSRARLTVLCAYLEMPLAWTSRDPVFSGMVLNKAYACDRNVLYPSDNRAIYRLITNKLDVLEMSLLL